MLKRVSLIVMVLQFMQTLLAAGTVIYIAALLSTEDYGRYVYYLTTAQILPLIVGLGTEHVFLMEASKSHRLLPWFFGNAVLTRVVLSLSVITLLALALALRPIESPGVVLAIVGGGLLAVFPNPLFLSLYRVQGVHIRPWLISSVGYVVFLLALGTAQAVGTVDIWLVSLGFLSSHVVTVLIFLWDLRGRVRPRFSLRYSRNYFRTGIVFSVSQGFDFAFARVDIFMIQFFLGPLALGIYAAAQRVVSLFLLIPSSFHVVELPEFHRASGSPQLLLDKFRGLRQLLWELGLLAYGAIILNSTFLIGLLFRETYAPAASIAVLLSVAGLLLFVNYPYYMLAEAVNRIKERLYLRIVTFVLTISAMAALIRPLGPEGAASSLIVGQLAFMGMLHYLTRRENGGLRSLLMDLRAVGPALVAGGLGYFVMALIAQPFVAAVAGSLVYLTVFVLSGHLLGVIVVLELFGGGGISAIATK